MLKSTLPVPPDSWASEILVVTKFSVAIPVKVIKPSFCVKVCSPTLIEVVKPSCPLGPVSPCSPWGPCGPVSPFAPEGPSNLFNSIKFLHSLSPEYLHWICVLLVCNSTSRPSAPLPTLSKFLILSTAASISDPECFKI